METLAEVSYIGPLFFSWQSFFNGFRNSTLTNPILSLLSEARTAYCNFHPWSKRSLSHTRLCMVLIQHIFRFLTAAQAPSEFFGSLGNVIAKCWLSLFPSMLHPDFWHSIPYEELVPACSSWTGNLAASPIYLALPLIEPLLAGSAAIHVKNCRNCGPVHSVEIQAWLLPTI